MNHITKYYYCPSTSLDIICGFFHINYIYQSIISISQPLPYIMILLIITTINCHYIHNINPPQTYHINLYLCDNCAYIVLFHPNLFLSQVLNDNSSIILGSITSFFDIQDIIGTNFKNHCYHKYQQSG